MHAPSASETGHTQQVAIGSEINGSYKIEKRRDYAMDDFELALLPILSIENSRMKVLSIGI